MSDPLNDALYDAANAILVEAAPAHWYGNPDSPDFQGASGSLTRSVSRSAIRDLFNAMRDLEALRVSL